MHLYLRMLTWARPYGAQVALAMAAMVVFGLTSALPFPLIKPMLDDIFVRGDVQSLVRIPLLLVGVFFLKGVSNFGGTYLMRRVGQSVVADLRTQQFEALLRLPLSFFHRQSSGDLLSRVLYDTAQVESALSRQIAEILKEALSLAFLLVALLWLSWQAALISVVVFPLLLRPLSGLRKRIRRASGDGQEQMGSLSSVLQEVFSGILVVKSFQMEQFRLRRFAEANQAYRSSSIEAAWLEALTNPVVELAAALIIAGTVYLGGASVIAGTTTTGTFFAFMAALFALYKPVSTLSRAGTQIQQALAAAERIFQILDTPPEPSGGERSLPAGPLTVRFRDVSFAYEERPILTNVDFELKPGETVALVGRSGAGKTTIAHLLLRLFDPKSGQIELNGVPIPQLRLESLRSRISLVTQETVLFRDTVRGNLAYGKGSGPEAQMLAALEAAAALDFVRRMPQGLDTPLGDRGAQLSGGQRQRLALARALLRDTPILLLDEATSALDSESEQWVQSALLGRTAGKTVLIIAHRLSTVQGADRILVLEEGRLVETGTHAELILAGGVYAKLFRENALQA